MAIIGLMGAMSVGKVQILRIFVDYVEKHDCGIIIEKKDFKGENEIEAKDGDGFSETITPNKVVFTEIKTGLKHTIFAPGRDRDPFVTRMEIITISRIAKQIIGVFAVDEPLEEQFKIYDLFRYIPKTINICITKCDLLKGKDEEKQRLLEDKKKAIIRYFQNRRIYVKGFNLVYFDTDNPEWALHNASNMIIHLSSECDIAKVMYYHGIPLFWYEYNSFIVLEKKVGKIPERFEITWDKFGFVANENHVIQLGMYKKGLTYLPEIITNLKSLEILNLRGNQITILPESLEKLVNLQKLVLSDNPLLSLSNIPLDVLRIADISNGNLSLKGRRLFASHNYKDVFQYYQKSPSILAQQYNTDPKTLTTDEKERLSFEAGHIEKNILEISTLPDDLILSHITERLSRTVTLSSGLKLYF